MREVFFFFKGVKQNNIRQEAKKKKRRKGIKDKKIKTERARQTQKRNEKKVLLYVALVLQWVGLGVRLLYVHKYK